MIETSGGATEPLLRPVTKEQLTLLEIVGEVVDKGAPPIYQYVQARMDDCGLDINSVLASMPTISHGQITCSLVRRDKNGGEAAPIRLTVAGLAHLERFASVVSSFLRVLDKVGEERANANFDPHNGAYVRQSRGGVSAGFAAGDPSPAVLLRRCDSWGSSLIAGTPIARMCLNLYTCARVL